MGLGVPDDAALADGFAASLELRLDEGHDFTPWRYQIEDRGENLLERDERDVDGSQRRSFLEETRIDRPGVHALHDHDPRVATQLLVELTSPYVDGVDTGSDVLQQAVREPAGRCADVHAHPASRIDLELVERMRELFSTTAHVRRTAANLDLGSCIDERSSL